MGQRFLYQLEVRYKQKIALHKEAGSRIICSQHGSRYGTLDAVPYIEAAEYNQDWFITWGWDKQSNYSLNTLPLPIPSPFLKSKKYNLNDRIIFIGQNSPLVSYRLDSMPQPGDFMKILNQLKIIISKLDPNILDKIYFKFHEDKRCALDYHRVITELIDNSKIIEKLGKHVYKSKLLIIDHPGTTLNIRLAANLPTIAYWDDKMWGLCAQTKPYFQSLKDRGILFDDATGAAERINEIWPDTESWWNQLETQQTIDKWVNQYARTKKSWRKEWIKSIWSLQ